MIAVRVNLIGQIVLALAKELQFHIIHIDDRLVMVAATGHIQDRGLQFEHIFQWCGLGKATPFHVGGAVPFPTSIFRVSIDLLIDGVKRVYDLLRFRSAQVMLSRVQPGIDQEII